MNNPTPITPEQLLTAARFVFLRENKIVGDADGNKSEYGWAIYGGDKLPSYALCYGSRCFDPANNNDDLVALMDAVMRDDQIFSVMFDSKLSEWRLEYFPDAQAFDMLTAKSKADLFIKAACVLGKELL